MTNSTHIEEFEVTLLNDLDSTISWSISADTPEQAIAFARKHPNSGTGIYSVWDPQDPNGMPLMECTF